ncbi:GxxExxY protein [Algiphilus aromaticivorans]|uniref:GxxExxY protein n=1 Tax=Algiphilus aromaticivorans TaxID=382454 RepID=UPI000A050C89|nr:GxxExxY protein [Algiphilus aromaticivorans]
MEPQISQIAAASSEKRDPETFAVIDAAMEAHRELGSGFLEAVYQDALEHELTMREISFRSQAPLPIHYKGAPLRTNYRADLICFDSIIVELKTVDQLGAPDQAQAINYLKATGLKKALLLNFKPSSLQYRRIVHRL